MEKVFNVVLWTLTVVAILFVAGVPLAMIGIKLAGCESVITGNMDTVKVVAFTWIALTVFLSGISQA